MMIFKRDPVMQLTAFVIIGVIITMVTFTDNTKTPLQNHEQPQSLLLSSK